MEQLFADVPAALVNAAEIARRCNLTLELGKPQLPRYPTPAGVTLDDHCRDLATAGLQRRLEALFRTSARVLHGAPSTRRASTSSSRPSRRWDFPATS